MYDQEPRQMTWSYTKPFCKLIDITSVERSTFDKGQRPLDSSFRAFPSRAERNCFRAASETRPKPSALGGCRAPIEPYITRQRSSRGAYRSTVYASRLDRHEYYPVPRRVTTAKGFVLSVKLEHGDHYSNYSSQHELEVDTTSENDRSGVTRRELRIETQLGPEVPARVAATFPVITLHRNQLCATPTGSDRNYTSDGATSSSEPPIPNSEFLRTRAGLS